MIKILVVDDVLAELHNLVRAVEGEGIEIFEASEPNQAILLIERHDFDLVVTDLKLVEDREGLEVLDSAKKKDVNTQVIVVTAYGNPEASVEAMRLGAFDYVERSAPGIHYPSMIRSKIKLALEYRKAIMGK